MSVKRGKGKRSAAGVTTWTDEEADALTQVHTAFENFDGLLCAPAYFPSLNVASNGAKRLADFYDAAQTARGDHRRVHRYKVEIVPALTVRTTRRAL